MIALIVAFWLMLPAYVPNNFAAIFGGGTPLDMGRVFQDGERTLGDGKTFSGTIAGTVCGVLMGLVQNQIAPFFGLPVFGTGFEQLPRPLPGGNAGGYRGRLLQAPPADETRCSSRYNRSDRFCDRGMASHYVNCAALVLA